MRDQNAFEAIHFHAALLVLIVSFNTPLSVVERLCTLNLLEKYGLCLALSLTLQGLNNLRQRALDVMKKRDPPRASGAAPRGADVEV